MNWREQAASHLLKTDFLLLKVLFLKYHKMGFAVFEVIYEFIFTSHNWKQGNHF